MRGRALDRVLSDYNARQDPAHELRLVTREEFVLLRDIARTGSLLAAMALQFLPDEVVSARRQAETVQRLCDRWEVTR